MKTKKAASQKLAVYSFDEVFKKKSPAFKRGYNEESNRISLAKKVREFREAMKLTQKAVAKEANMPQSVIARIESGEYGISVDTLSKVAYALGKKITLV